MVSGRTRRVEFSRVRISSPARRGPYDEEGDEDDMPVSSGPMEESQVYKYINYVAIAGHFISAMAMIGIYASKDTLAIPYTENVNAWNRVPENGTCPNFSRELETANNGKFCVGPEQRTFDCDGDPCALDYGWMIISFHLLSFLFQGLAAITDWVPILGYKYSEMIKDGKNPLRFIEYSISASLMLMIIGLINGIVDIHLLFCIGVLTGSCQLCGLVVEYLNDDQLGLKWINHLNGWITFLSAYWCISRAFIASADAVEGVSPPDFVYAIVVILFLLYACFGLVQLFELMCVTERFKCNALCKYDCCKGEGRCPAFRRKDRCNPLYKEMVYVTLSLGAKLVLGWMLFVNILMA